MCVCVCRAEAEIGSVFMHSTVPLFNNLAALWRALVISGAATAGATGREGGVSVERREQYAGQGGWTRAVFTPRCAVDHRWVGCGRRERF